MKKGLFLLLAMCCFLTICADVTVKVDGIIYTLRHVVGKGTFASVDAIALPSEDRATIRIPDTVVYNRKSYPVTELKDECFGGDVTIGSIELPSTLTILNANAFWECKGIKKLIIPASVTSIVGKLRDVKQTPDYNYVDIEEYVFEDSDDPLDIDLCFNTTAKKVYLGRNIISNSQAENTDNADIPTLFFATDVETVIVGPKVTVIPNEIFKFCRNLSEVKFSLTDNLEDVGVESFSGCNVLRLENNSLPNSVKRIGREAFSDCKIMELDSYPDALEEIAYGAFSGTSISKVNFEPNLKTIGDRAFQNTKVNEVKWPIGTTVVNNAYCECKNITSINFPEGITVIGIEAFNKCTSLRTIEFPGTLRVISDRAFSYCESLKSLSIPGSVDSVGSDFLRNTFLDHLVFENSDVPLDVDQNTRIYNVRNVYLGRNILPGNGLFQYAPLDTVRFGSELTYLPPYFTGNSRLGESGNSLDSIVIPPNIVRIAPEIFSGCTELKSVTLSPNITTLPKGVFYKCSSLESLIVPPKVRSIETDAFVGAGLKDLYMMPVNPPTSLNSNPKPFSQEQYRIIRLHVPAESYDAYNSTMPWMLFSNIIKEDFSGIDSLPDDSQDGIDWAAPLEVYTLSGTRVGNMLEELPTGFYIVRQGKVMVKVAVP